MKNKYVFFKKIASKPKTDVYEIIEKKEESVLGIIKWYAPWRQYCFYPEGNTIWSKGCMQEVINFLILLKIKRKR